MIPPRFRIFTLALVLVAGLSACKNTPSADVAAEVNGDAITDAQVSRITPSLQLLTTMSGGSCSASANPVPPPSSPGASDPDCSKRALELLIQAQVVKGYASEHKIVPTATEINDAVTSIENQAGGKAQFDEQLAQAGVTADALRDFITPIILLQDVQKAFGDTYSEQDVQAFYENNKSQYTIIDTAHILVETQEEALKIKQHATKSNFASLAEKLSTDPGSAAKGGDLGEIPAASLVPEYSDAVLAAKPGQIIGPVQSQFGWHVIWVKKVQVQPFDEVKDQVAQTASSDGFNAWLQQQLESAQIKVNPRYGSFDKATGTISTSNSTAASPGAAAPSP